MGTFAGLYLCMPHHGMEEWFNIQSFYHGLIHSAQEHIDVTARGYFFTLSIE
jgi:hypothetical protein